MSARVTTNPIFIKRGLVTNHRALPILIPYAWKWPAGILTFGLGGILYVVTNHHAYSPAYLPLTELDQGIPFLPWTIWIYLSLFIYIPFVFFLNRCTVSFNKHLYSFVSILALSVIIFHFNPTIYPRTHYPNSAEIGSWTYQIIEKVRGIDQPKNCFPSLHVSIALDIALGFLDDLQHYFPLILGWALLLILSTLTTKQHYVWDVLGGTGLALSTHFLLHRLAPYRLAFFK